MILRYLISSCRSISHKSVSGSQCSLPDDWANFCNCLPHFESLRRSAVAEFEASSGCDRGGSATLEEADEGVNLDEEACSASGPDVAGLHALEMA